jgi:hypothetical protein
MCPPSALAPELPIATDVPAVIVSALAAFISLTALLMSVLRQRQGRIESVIDGLRGDRRAVTYAALTIRLSRLLRREDYRRSLIASLLLAWNFETSDRARSAVLAALVDAKKTYPADYGAVVADLGTRFDSYQAAYPEAQIERGVSRLQGVTSAVEAAEAAQRSRLVPTEPTSS